MVGYLYPSTKRTTRLPVGELVLWCGMFTPKEGLEWYHGLARGAPFGKQMKRIIYPKSLKDIPPWRQQQLAQDLLWFSEFSPVERLQYIDREWEEIQDFIKKFGLKGHGTRKKN